jgi:hypothetical protein
MADEKELNELMGRMINDVAFRKQLMADPKAAVEEAGYDLTDEQLAQFGTPEMGDLIGAVDERASKVLPIKALYRRM